MICVGISLLQCENDGSFPSVGLLEVYQSLSALWCLCTHQPLSLPPRRWSWTSWPSSTSSTSVFSTPTSSWRSRSAGTSSGSQSASPSGTALRSTTTFPSFELPLPSFRSIFLFFFLLPSNISFSPTCLLSHLGVKGSDDLMLNSSLVGVNWFSCCNASSSRAC